VTTTGEGGTRRRGFETTGDLVRSLLVVLVLVFVVVALTVRPHPASEVRRFDYSGVLVQARDLAPYDVLAPFGLPDTWVPTSARTAREGAAVTWHVGFVTPGDDYAGLEQSDGAPASFVAQLADRGVDAGTVEIGGATWRRVQGGDPEPRALVLRGDRVTTAVAGNATWAELRVLAASLRAG
jgi:Protein of unknown function (DUF4245)